MKKMAKTALDFTKTGVVAGIGSSVIGSVGGDASSVSNLTKHMPLLGNIAGSSHVLSSLKKLKK